MKKALLGLIAAACLLISFDKPVGYKPGDTVINFSLKNVDGKMVGPGGYKNAKGYILVFTCNHCPFAKLYQERMNQLNKTYAPQGFPLLAVSSNDAEAVPEDGFEEMKQRAKEKHYNFPYLYDESQDVARAFGAVKTPHAFVVLKESGKWVLKYSGAIDDNGSEPDKVKNRFVATAVDALLRGDEVATKATKSVGCGIKWKQ
ncbi:MAG: thioredoxin family protein [Taibaiella sp.]|nr:thioredoxin family protein [Taibaiella sp.]